MAKTEDELNDVVVDETPAAPPAGMVSMDALANAIGASVASALESRDSKTKKVTFGEYTRRMNAGKSKFTREYYQNGFKLSAVDLDNVTIDALNRISRTGRYIDRKVEVIVRDEGADSVVEIRYANKTADQRMELRGNIRSFTDLVQQIVVAQDIENAAEAAQKRPAVVPRSFGDSKASRDARAAAGQ